MKKKKNAGSLSKKFFGKILLLVSAALAAAMLASCTLDEALTVADSLARRYYLEEGAEPTVKESAEPTKESAEPTVEPTAAPTTEPAQPEQTTAGEPDPTAATTFEMPFLDSAHGGIDYRVTQGFSSSHGGLDIGVYWGTPILAATDGKVVYAYNDGDLPTSDLRWTYGTFVVIESFDGVFRTYYAHMQGRTVSVGDTVRQGDTIGYSGNTGRVSSSSSGPYAGTHLHFEVRVWNGSSFVRRDPKLYLPWWN